MRSYVSGEPEYVDQVPRRLAYEASHPGVKITYARPWWRAVIRGEDGGTIITRVHLWSLMDKLESLDVEP